MALSCKVTASRVTTNSGVHLWKNAALSCSEQRLRQDNARGRWPYKVYVERLMLSVERWTLSVDRVCRQINLAVSFLDVILPFPISLFFFCTSRVTKKYKKRLVSRKSCEMTESRSAMSVLLFSSRAGKFRCEVDERAKIKIAEAGITHRRQRPPAANWERASEKGKEKRWEEARRERERGNEAL